MTKLGPLPDLPRGIKARYAYTWSGRPMFAVFHLQYSTSVPAVAELNTLAGIVKAAWSTNIKPLLGTAVTLNYTDVQDVSSRTGAYYQNTATDAGSNGWR